MVILKNDSTVIPVKMIFFANKPVISKGLFVTFRSTGTNRNHPLFRREAINTLINTLSGSETELLRSFKKNTVYEIVRSIKEKKVEIDSQATMDDFIPLYNQFASNRGWRNYKVRTEMLNNFHVTTSKLDGKVVIAHLYFLDHNSKRVCLEASVSNLDSINDLHEKALIGRSNRHLHYSDMLYFKQAGFEYYDFGGYDNHNINDKKKIGINKFKEGFKGDLVYESNYISYPLFILFKVKKLRRLAKNYKLPDISIIALFYLQMILGMNDMIISNL